MMEPGEVTCILSRLRDGEREAFDELFPVVYEQLRHLAGKHVGRERSGHSLQATALTHEAYLRLLGELEDEWQNRAHFFAVAARAMRQILIESARAKNRIKRGGGQAAVPLDTKIPDPSNQDSGDDLDLLALDEALTELSESYPRKARVVELLYFGGLTHEEAGEVVGVTERTVQRDWHFARLWLLRRMDGIDLRGPE